MKTFDFEIRVPASSSNLGPGFDVLGIAVDLPLRVRVQPSPSRAQVLWFEGLGCDQLAQENDSLILRVVQRAARRFGVSLPPLRMTIHNEIPLSRGLGSSAAAITAGISIAEFFSFRKISHDDFFRVALEFESHPDNLASCLVGGFTAARLDGKGSAIVQSLPLDPRLKVIAAVPDLEIPTRDARRVLPARIPFADAVKNLQNTVLLSHALRKISKVSLQTLFSDRLHQPYRLRLAPGLKEALSLPEMPGLVGVYLSGAGSTVAAPAVKNFRAIGRALQNCFSKRGLSSTILALNIDRKGRRSRRSA